MAHITEKCSDKGKGTEKWHKICAIAKGKMSLSRVTVSLYTSIIERIKCEGKSIVRCLRKESKNQAWGSVIELEWERGFKTIVITPKLVSDVLHVPRVEHPDYSDYEHLRTVSKDEMISAFCEHPTDWGDHQFTPCSTFVKGPRLRWWWLLFGTLFLIITLSQRPVLGFCFHY